MSEPKSEKVRVELSGEEMELLERQRSAKDLALEPSFKIRLLSDAMLPCPPTNFSDAVKRAHEIHMAKQGTPDSTAKWRTAPLGAVMELPHSVAERLLRNGHAEMAGRGKCTPLESWPALKIENRKEQLEITRLYQLRDVGSADISKRSELQSELRSLEKKYGDKNNRTQLYTKRRQGMKDDDDLGLHTAAIASGTKAPLTPEQVAQIKRNLDNRPKEMK